MISLKKIIAFVVVIGILAISVCVLAAAIPNPVPDTGQTQSYTNTFGEDSDYVINPPSYTKLNAYGNALPDSASSWSMVKDNVTGLIWENKTDNGSIHDKDDTYNWYNAQNVFIANLNRARFGGFSDWRLPTIKELSSIVNSGTYNPAINTAYFPNTLSSSYWSSTTDVHNADSAWDSALCVGFDGGVSRFLKSSSYYVRAVRGGQSGSLGNLVINGDGTVTDTSTGLMWQQQTAGQMTWEEAINYCEGLSLGGYSDWRLPNRNELQSLVDYTRYSPAIDNTAFPDTMSFLYWSSTTTQAYDPLTTLAYDPVSAWCVAFDGGEVVSWVKPVPISYVRAVRGGWSDEGDMTPRQLNVTGKVTDAGTGNPVPSATVILWCRECTPNSAVMLTTDANGDYYWWGPSCFIPVGKQVEIGVAAFKDGHADAADSIFPMRNSNNPPLAGSVQGCPYLWTMQTLALH
jgi:hypothetical protein